MSDLLFYIELLKREKKIILISCLLFFVFGIIYLVVTPNKYVATTTFVAQGNSGAANGLGGLAAVAGIQIGGGGDKDLISHKLYGEIIYSNRFLRKLSNFKFKDPHDNEVKSLKAILLKRKINDNDSLYDNSVLEITDEEYIVFKILRTKIAIDFDSDNNKFTLSVANETPRLAAEILTRCKEILQTTIIDYKINKAKQDLVFIEKSFEEQKKAFLEKQKKLANYKDSNRSLITQRSQSTILKLEAEYNLAFTLYNEISQKRETQRLKIKEKIPVFITIKEVSVPKDKSFPVKKNILILSLIGGIIIGLILILIKEFKTKLSELSKLNK